MPVLKTLAPRLRTLDSRTLRPSPGTIAVRAPKVTASFYGSTEWQTLRKAIMRERGKRCEDCGSTSGRMYCDHVKELRDGGAPLDRLNIRVRCASCHSRKTAQVRADRLRS
ncbi:MAG: HNH endonuclease [Methylorubrum rhodinum]|uniref:HNH endonuclease n=1 Tax=Methylorubrum rhodinum TaxID=29428 RepID=UPI003BB0941D